MGVFDVGTTFVGEDGSAQIVPGWDIGGRTNGGFLVALAANGLRAMAGRADPITVTAHFLAPGTPGPVHVSGEVVKRGKRLTTVRGVMLREGRPLLQMLAAFGELSASDGAFEYSGGRPPDLPPFDSLDRRTQADSPVPIPMLEHVDVRIGGPAAPGETAGWFAFADGRPVDTLALLFVCDALPPAVFSLPLEPGWVPTVEFTVHVRGAPAPDPVRCRFRTRFVQHG